MGTTNRELSPTCQLFLPTSSQVVLTAIILVSEVRKSGLEIISGFASGLRRKDLELGFEPKTINHFPLHQEEERKERGSGPHRARPCFLGTQLKSFVGESALPSLGCLRAGSPDRKGRFPAASGSGAVRPDQEFPAGRAPLWLPRPPELPVTEQLPSEPLTGAPTP